MSCAEPIEPSDPQAGGGDVPTPTKPDWLVGADESIGRETGDPRSSGGNTDDPRRPVAPAPKDRKVEPHLKLVAAQEAPPPPTSEAPAGEPAGTVAWKAAASSVPRLRQQPAASNQPAASESFTGFAQDAIMTTSASAIGGRGAQSAAELLGGSAGEGAMPLAQDSPFWVDWLERLQSLPRPVMIGAGAVLVLGALAYLLYPRDTPGVSLAQIRQHPEAYEGRSVRVGGKAGEAFSVGGSYVYSLYQGRDTVVVYSRTRPARLHERVKVDGTVSIGYLDGAPRVAVLENPSAR